MSDYQLRQTIGFTLFRTSMRLKGEFSRELNPFDITTEQFAVLGLLWERDALLQRELAELLFKDRPNITRILEKLERKGLVERTPDNLDRRATRVNLTPSGAELEKPLTRLALDFRTGAYRGLTNAEMRELGRLLDRILENLS